MRSSRNVFYEPAFALAGGDSLRPRRRRGAGLVGHQPAQAARLFSGAHRAAALRAQAAGARRLDASLCAARHAAGRARSGRAGHRRLARAPCRRSRAARIGAVAVLARRTARSPRRSMPSSGARRCRSPISIATAGRSWRRTTTGRSMSSARSAQHRHKELRRYVRRLGDLGALLFTTATEPEPPSPRRSRISSRSKSRGWKGKAGTAAILDDDVHGFITAAVARPGGGG